MRQLVFSAASLLAVSVAFAAGDKPFDAAAAFGALPSVSHLRLSPDGKNVAYLSPSGPSGSALYTNEVTMSRPSTRALVASGKPERLESCSWVSNERLVCTVYGVVKGGSELEIMPFTRLVAADQGGGHVQLLSNRTNEYTHGYLLSGGEVIDWLPDEDGSVLMSRRYLPDDHLGSRAGSTKEGLGVDHLDTRTLQTEIIEPPFRDVSDYISDGRGVVRIIGRYSTVEGDQNSGVYRYSYRKIGSREWLPLATYNYIERSGFLPRAVDYERNVVYGLRKVNGRFDVHAIALDGSMLESVVYSNPNVDADGLLTIGRRNRVVGVTYVTDYRHAAYFDPDVDRLMRSLAKALPQQTRIDVVDSSFDERMLLIIADSDDDPGVYYLFDRRTKELKTFLVVRSQLEGVKLAKVKPITYPAADGTEVPGYLTLPPGVDSPKGLPAIVLPHGGPSARDEWGFDWLSQFYASRGYAVLQPNFRGSAGYGDAWLQQNGFKSWRTAIGDVLDAGRWLVSQGIADPAKLSVVGWSYGGYAALQSAVVEPGLFKAVVAIAPVTDLEQLKEEWRHWDNFYFMRAQVGDGPHIREGSPARNADKIKVPVLMFHGTLDRNVSVNQSRVMDSRLERAGVKHQLVTFDGLDHYLEDSDARTEVLRKSDEFLRAAIGGGS